VENPISFEHKHVIQFTKSQTNIPVSMLEKTQSSVLLQRFMIQ